MAGLLSGAKEKLEKVFSDKALSDLASVSLGDGDLETMEDELSAALGERYDILLKLKAVYDLARLDSIMKGSGSIPEAMVKIFNNHKRDLELLKEFLRDSDRGLYREIFGVP